jgi:hypothetical protein
VTGAVGHWRSKPKTVGNIFWCWERGATTSKLFPITGDCVLRWVLLSFAHITGKRDDGLTESVCFVGWV